MITRLAKSDFFMQMTILVSVSDVKAGAATVYQAPDEFTGKDSSCIMSQFIRSK
jgi:hypothetical protein